MQYLSHSTGSVFKRYTVLQSPCTSFTSGMGISFKMGKGSVCGVYTSLKPMIHFDSKQSQSIFNQNYYKNAMANNCKQCSIRIISHTTTRLPKAYDCVAVYIAGRRTSLVVYGWWPQPPTKKKKKYTLGAKRPPRLGEKRLCAWRFTPQFCQLVPCNKLAIIVAMDT